MDLNLPLLLLATASAFALGLRASLTSPRAWDWALVSTTVLVAGAITWVVTPARAGYVTFTFWALVVAAPMLLTRGQARALARQRYGLALALGRALVALHPSRSIRAALVRVRATCAAARGDLVTATRALEEYGRLGPWQAAEARLEIARLRQDRVELREALSAPPPAESPAFALSSIRALLEVGDRDAAIARFLRVEPMFDAESAAPLRAAACLALFADAGREAEVLAVLDGRLRDASSELRRLWVALARASAGDPRGAAELRSLQRSKDHLVRRAATLRLARPAGEPPTSELDALLRRLSLRLEEEDIVELGAARPRPPRLTQALALVILAVWCLEHALGGSEDQRVLYELGALWAPAVLEHGEWWRLVAPLFLHFGAAHAAFNLAGLWILGPFVERALGRARFVVVYLLSGIAGTVLFCLRSALWPGDDALLVGASGSIMGLVGATIGVLARTARLHARAAGRRRIFTLGLVLLLQTAFDLAVPNVSLFAHSVGAIVGLALALVLTDVARRS